jgi:hypothetical protein
MNYGPLPARRLPTQDAKTIRLIADRHYRASVPLSKWAKQAKECVDFVEGRQWTEAQLRKLAEEKRPALVFNKIAPLVRLVTGYMRNNRTDIKFMPASDSASTQEVAEALSMIAKSIAEGCGLKYVDAEVFLDGIITGRGFWDQRLDFTDNDLGEIKITAKDPFTIGIDPDCQDYDLNKGAAYVYESRWASLDDVEFAYGPQARRLVEGVFGGHGTGQTWGAYPYLDLGGDVETPIRGFGMDDNIGDRTWRDYCHTELIDPTRKNVRVLDMQSKETRWGEVLVDLETGDRMPVPTEEEFKLMYPGVPPMAAKQNWVQKAIAHGEKVGNPLVLDIRPVERIRWTVLVGDVLVHDGWSPYDRYTIEGFFPYFRRGVTRGMVEDMLDPQREINKRRSATIEIVGKTANAGWVYHKDSLDPDQRENLKRYGSTPGVSIEYKGDPSLKPERINPAPPPTSMERLEVQATDDLHQISGINESAMGEIDKVQSGRAIEARQRQAVLSLQLYFDNFSRSKEIQGRHMLVLVQRHYPEPRVFRVLGEDGKQVTLEVNKRVMDPTGATLTEKIRDITVGKYTVCIDETPLSASFQNAQFEEAMGVLEKLQGAIPIQAFGDLLIDMSSLPRKEEWKQRFQQVMGIGQAAPPVDPMTGQPIDAATGQSVALPGGGGGAPAALPAPAPAPALPKR